MMVDNFKTLEKWRSELGVYNWKACFKQCVHTSARGIFVYASCARTSLEKNGRNSPQYVLYPNTERQYDLARLFYYLKRSSFSRSKVCHVFWSLVRPLHCHVMQINKMQQCIYHFAN